MMSANKKSEGHCIVCGSDLLLEVWRVNPRSQKRIHCNYCGSEVAPHIHKRYQTTHAPFDLKAEMCKLLKEAFDCGFNASDEHAFWHFDGPALADNILDSYWQKKGL